MKRLFNTNILALISSNNENVIISLIRLIFFVDY